ncbi:MAG: hypothetical protein ACTHK5_01600 [Tsuneonella sp.]
MPRLLTLRRTLRWAAPAIAAAVALAVLLPESSSGPTQMRDGLTFASGGLARALDRQLVADQRTGSETRVLLSFADEQGTLCRGFARADLSGIACREHGGWHLRVQRDGVDVQGNDSRQAEAVDRAIVAAARAMATGPALGAPQERAARAHGWTAQ